MKNKKIICIIFFLLLLLSQYKYIFLFINNTSYQKFLTKLNVIKSEKYINHILRQNPIVDDYYTWNKEYIFKEWTYYNGFMMYALMKINSPIPDEFYSSALDYYENHDYDAGDYSLFADKEIDTVMPAYPLLKYKNQYTKTKNYIYNMLLTQPRLPNCGGNFVHKDSHQNWREYKFSLDGLYMALPFFASYGNKDVTKNFEWVNKALKTENGLLYHGAKEDGTQNGVVWLRGLGWYSMALVEIIELTKDTNNKQILISYLTELFDSLIEIQNPINGMWHNVITDEHIKCNRYETSGTLMIAYSMIKAYSMGYVNDEKYRRAGLKAFNGTLTTKLNNYHLKDIYLYTPIYNNPQQYCDCKNYIDDEAKGIAPLIMIYAELNQ